MECYEKILIVDKSKAYKLNVTYLYKYKEY